MSVKAAEAANLRKAYEELCNNVEKFKQERQEETNLINSVNQLILQCDDIDGKMTTAITAMAELSALFSTQADCYDKIACYLGNIKVGTTSTSLTNRKYFIDYSLGKTVDKLKEVSR